MQTTKFRLQLKKYLVVEGIYLRNVKGSVLKLSKSSPIIAILMVFSNRNKNICNEW